MRKIFTGSPIGCVEGPHLYKRNGWYYLLTAEGGMVYNNAAAAAAPIPLKVPTLYIRTIRLSALGASLDCGCKKRGMPVGAKPLTAAPIWRIFAGVRLPARKEEGPALPKEGSVWMGLSAREHSGVFRYSMDGEHFTDVGRTLDSRMLSDEFDTLGFTGASVGMFCVDTVRYEAAADFKRFLYRPSISKGLERRKN